MEENNDKPLHIAMYPWFALSHITSNLHLANKLAKRGHKVSLFLPPNAHTKVASHNYHPNLISFIPISIPPVNGLPPGAETTNDVPRSRRPILMTAMDLTCDVICTHLVNLKPDFVLFDFAYWMPKMAKELGIKSIFYNTGYLVRIAFTFPKFRDLPTGQYVLKEADLARPPPGFPSQAIELKPHEARALAAATKLDFGGLPFVERLKKGLEECDAIGSKTCREMEGHYCDFIEKFAGKPVLLAGPVIPEPLASVLDQWFDSWLRGFGNNCVIYCAFGSECVLGKDQFQELVLGLEHTGMPFLAALKPPMGYETIASALPEGFAERTKGKGIVHGGWVQQQLILKHPSVGCFVTHCGSGSLSEGMVSKCALVMIPQAVDQFINAKLLGSELKVGVEVETTEDGFVTKEAIVKAVSAAMNEESEVRVNHAKWRDFLLGQGLEESYIHSFTQKLYDLLE